MKILKILTLLSIVCINGFSQDIPEPDFIQKPYYFKDGKLEEFEKVESTVQGKSKGMGYGGVELSYSANGIKSQVRFPSNALPKIVVKIDDGTDPSDGFSFIVAEIKKDKRRFVTGKMGGLGNNNSVNEKKVSISAKKIRDKVFEITFQTPLVPGEYAIIPNQKNATMASASMAIKMNCFGID